MKATDDPAPKHVKMGRNKKMLKKFIETCKNNNRKRKINSSQSGNMFVSTPGDCQNPSEYSIASNNFNNTNASDADFFNDNILTDHVINEPTPSCSYTSNHSVPSNINLISPERFDHEYFVDNQETGKRLRSNSQNGQRNTNITSAPSSTEVRAHPSSLESGDASLCRNCHHRINAYTVQPDSAPHFERIQNQIIPRTDFQTQSIRETSAATAVDQMPRIQLQLSAQARESLPLLSNSNASESVSSFNDEPICISDDESDTDTSLNTYVSAN